jgi:hypothetical protein
LSWLADLVPLPLYLALGLDTLEIGRQVLSSLLAKWVKKIRTDVRARVITLGFVNDCQGGERSTGAVMTQAVRKVPCAHCTFALLAPCRHNRTSWKAQVAVSEARIGFVHL